MAELRVMYRYIGFISTVLNQSINSYDLQTRLKQISFLSSVCGIGRPQLRILYHRLGSLGILQILVVPVVHVGPKELF